MPVESSGARVIFCEKGLLVGSENRRTRLNHITGSYLDLVVNKTTPACLRVMSAVISFVYRHISPSRNSRSEIIRTLD